MSRKPRSFIPGQVYHLISRFIDREWFITQDHERHTYLQLLGRAMADTDWRFLTYGVMSNHVHLGTIAGHASLDSWIRRVHGPFADAMNKVHDRIGSMFVRGPKAIAVPPDRVPYLLAYIHNNPVRAGCVGSAVESDWTSHRAYVGLDDRPGWLDVEEGLSRGRFSTPQAFDAWVRASAANQAPELEPARPAEEEAKVYVLGSTPHVTHDVDDVVRAVSDVTSISVEALRSRRRGQLHVLARRAAVQCADALGISGVTVAAALGISQQRASAILTAECQPSQVNPIVADVLAKVGGRNP